MIMEEKEDRSMGSPYLNPDETILLSTHNLFVNTVPAEAILTSARLILVDTRDAQIQPQDIPFNAIETVTTGENAAEDPMLSLSMVTGPGITKSLGVVFVQTPKTKRSGERDEWTARLKELSAAEIQKSGIQPMEIPPPWIPGDIPEAGPGNSGGSDTPGSGMKNPPLIPRPRPESSSKNRTMLAIAAVVVIIAAIAITVYFFAPSLLGTAEPPVPTPIITTTMTAIATPALTPVTTVDTPPQTVLPTVIQQPVIPQTGVWIQIKYAGNYSGILGAPGRYSNIVGKGDHIYQIPARNETVTATVQKLDSDGNVLTVEFYNEGKLVRSGSIRTPQGTLQLFANLNTM
jgi:hypothetical protein